MKDMDIKVGDVYKFKDICNLLGLPFTDATNKKDVHIEEYVTKKYLRIA